MAAACDERQSCLRSCSRAVHPRSARNKTISNSRRSVPSPPFPNRANEALPPWLRVRGEFRERFEGFAHSGFTPERDDSYFLSRLRINAVVTPSRFFSATVQLQDARVAQKEVGPTTPPFRGPLDLRMAYADIGDVQKGVVVGPRGPAGARVRRAAADRAPQLDQHRAELRRRTGHDSARRVSGRRVRRIGRANRCRLVRRERQRQSARRRLRLALEARARMRSSSPTFSGAPTATCAPKPRRPATSIRRRSARASTAKLPAGLDYGIEIAGQDGLARLRLDRRLGRALAAARVVRRLLNRPADWRVQLRERRPDADRRRARDVRSAVSDRPRQAGPRRSGRMAQHPPCSRRPRDHTSARMAGHRQPPCLVARQSTRRPLQRRRRADCARRRRRRLDARRSGDRRAADARDRAADSSSPAAMPTCLPDRS